MNHYHSNDEVGPKPSASLVMLYGIVAALTLIAMFGCDHQRPKSQARSVKVLVEVGRKPQPVVDVPCSVRYRNPDGSCVHCAWCTLLEHNHMHETAVMWRSKYHGGESASGLRAKANREGVRFADTVNGDVHFVDWACRTGRGCLVNDRPGHVRTLVGIDPAGTPGAKAYVLDNNGPPERIIEYNRDEWINMWKSRGGWACTPVYNPAPPTTRS